MKELQILIEVEQVINSEVFNEDDRKKLEACIAWVTGHYEKQKKVYQPKPLNHKTFVKRNGFNANLFLELLEVKLKLSKKERK